ncbi:MAG: zinc ribbon domain-containing protein [Candidatus Pacebacteria bacterium]|nr:zinc ribbon domain-containing protein [Candidatus Paceibacterota bacterium]
MGIESEGNFTPLISKELFAKCNSARRKHKYPPYKVNNPAFPLRGLVVCGHCLQKLTASYSTGRGGVRYPHYQHQKKNCPHARSIRKNDIETQFVKLLDEINPTLKFENVFKAIVSEEWKRKTKDSFDVNIKLIKEIETLEKQKEDICNLLEKGIYTEDLFTHRISSINSQILEKRSDLVDTKIKDLDLDKALEYCFTLIRNTSTTWLEYENIPDKRVRFYNLIFEEKLSFLNNEFGTTKLSPIFNVYQRYLVDPSNLVTLPGIEPGLPP